MSYNLRLKIFLHLACDFSSQKVLIIKTLCKFAAKSVSLSKRYTFFSSFSQNLIHHVPNRLSIIKCLFYFCSVNLNGCQRIIMTHSASFEKRPKSFRKRLKPFSKTWGVLIETDIGEKKKGDGSTLFQIGKKVLPSPFSPLFVGFPKENLLFICRDRQDFNISFFVF